MRVGITSAVLTMLLREIYLGSSRRRRGASVYELVAETKADLFREDSEPGSSSGSPYGEEDAMAMHNILAASDGNTGYWFDIRDYAGSYEETSNSVKGYVIEYSPSSNSQEPTGPEDPGSTGNVFEFNGHTYEFVSNHETWLNANMMPMLQLSQRQRFSFRLFSNC